MSAAPLLAAMCSRHAAAGFSLYHPSPLHGVCFNLNLLLQLVIAESAMQRAHIQCCLVAAPGAHLHGAVEELHLVLAVPSGGNAGLQRLRLAPMIAGHPLLCRAATDITLQAPQWGSGFDVEGLTSAVTWESIQPDDSVRLEYYVVPKVPADQAPAMYGLLQACLLLRRL